MPFQGRQDALRDRIQALTEAAAALRDRLHDPDAIAAATAAMTRLGEADKAARAAGSFEDLDRVACSVDVVGQSLAAITSAF